MKESTIMIVLMFFYVGLLGSAVIDENWSKVLYWSGAIMVTGAVWMMK